VNAPNDRKAGGLRLAWRVACAAGGANTASTGGQDTGH